MSVSTQNEIIVSKVIALDVINDVRRLCFGGALSRAVFFEKLFFSVNSLFFRNKLFSLKL